jgi:DNA-binding response OmpR family regulator
MEDKRILIVEDDENSALLLKDFFRINGFVADHVKDGITAVSKIETGEFHAIILDLRLPGQNGFVTAEKIRQTAGGTRIPIIVLTAFADSQNKLRAYQAGANYVLAKPVNIKELFHIIKNLLSLLKA